MAFDEEVGVDFIVIPRGGYGDGGGAVVAMGNVMEEFHCHAIGVEEQEGDVVLACAGDGLSIPQECCMECREEVVRVLCQCRLIIMLR